MKKIVLITGASGGIGSAILKSFDKSNYHVVSVGKSDSNEFKTDLSSAKKSVATFKKIFKKYGRIDVFINSVGCINSPKYLEEITDKEYAEEIACNLNPLFFALRFFIPKLKSTSAIIINISSTAGLSAHPKFPIYSAVKAAGNALMQSTAKALENTNVKAINICPGPTNTKMRVKIFGKKEANCKQSPKVIAKTVLDIINGRLKAANGDFIVVRDGKTFIL